MTTILLVAICVFGLPAWIPGFRGKYSEPLLGWAFGLIALNEILQLIFVAAVGTDLIPLYYSARFALVGLTLCLAGGIIGLTGGMRHGVGIGCLVTDAFSMFCWLFLVSMH
jgi:hypothetical protein